MNVKQIICLAAIAVGVLTIGYGMYSKRSISQMKNEIQQLSQSKNQTIKSFGQDLEAKTVGKGAGTKWVFLGGTILIILGAWTAYRWQNKKRR